MKNNTIKTMKLASFEDLFGSEEVRSNDQVTYVPLDSLHAFKNHPFRVNDDEEMLRLTESILQQGVLVPGVVRIDPEGGYELISGHRRLRACEHAGLKEMPVFIRDMDDDTATMFMVDANLQREHILASEKAHAYKMKYEALKHQGVQGDMFTADMVGENTGDSRRTVYRYLRLAELEPKILEWVDAGLITLTAGESLSYIDESGQKMIAHAIDIFGRFLGKEQADKLKEQFLKGTLTKDAIVETFSRKKRERSSVNLPAKRLQNYFPEGYTKQQIEDVIFELLETWKKTAGEEIEHG